MRLCLFLFLLGALSVRAEVLVIVSEACPVDSLTRKEVVELFMGRRRALRDGQDMRPVDFDKGNILRQRFYRALTGKSEAQIDAYWAQLLFAGRVRPPQQVTGAAAMLAAVSGSNSALGYIEAGELGDGVKVVLSLGE